MADDTEKPDDIENPSLIADDTEKPENPKPSEDSWSCLGIIFGLFVGVFYIPIMWLTEKFKGNGVGFGAAFASFGAATIIIMIAVIAVVVAAGVGIYAVFWG